MEATLIETPTSRFPDLVTPWRRYKAGLWKKSPCTSNRASQIGADCERELVYWRARWDEAAEPSDDLRILLQEGEKHEREVLIELQRAGIQVLEQQAGLHWPAVELSGCVELHTICVVLSPWLC